ncbi:MAG: glycosyltransferase family 2 protein [Oscillospiraceae bacterium]|nr:glycosyltransferase family 2 protein [Oscillospiraceae bacterium]
MDTPVLSVIIPAYNEGPVLTITTEHLQTVLSEANIFYEILFVDDGSTDDTWQQIESLAKKDTRIVGVKLSRNFGKESAMLAGLEHATGSACALMDCDMQHPPSTLVEMYNVWKSGNVDVVEGVKQSRGKESLIYKGFSNLFYYLIERTGKIKLRDASDFQLLDRRVVDIIIRLPERQRFFRALSSWVGFNRKEIFFTVEPRASGTSKFNFYTSTKYALNNITSFSSAPLQIVTITGTIFFILSIVLGIQTLVLWISGEAIEGFTTVILLLLIIGAMIMFSMGIMGYFIGKIYEETKYRPPYLVETSVNQKKTQS